MTYLKDLAERAAATYVQSFLGLLLVSWSTELTFGVVQAAAIAAVPALLSVLKSGLAKYTGNPQDASLVK